MSDKLAMAPEQLPRVFQCNLDRLFQRVIKAGLEAHPIHPQLAFGQADTLDQFLDRCGAQVDNYMANEAAKAYALTLAAVFERQLHTFMRQLWATGAVTPDPPPSPPKRGKPRPPNYGELLRASAAHAKIDLDALGLAAPLKELLLVGNVVRHGEGESCETLQAFAPRLWAYDPSSYVDLLPGPASPSEKMQILADDLVGYAVAAMTFWGHADTLPMATRQIPGYGPINFSSVR